MTLSYHFGKEYSFLISAYFFDFVDLTGSIRQDKVFVQFLRKPPASWLVNSS